MAYNPARVELIELQPFQGWSFALSFLPSGEIQAIKS